MNLQVNHMDSPMELAGRSGKAHGLPANCKSMKTSRKNITIIFTTIIMIIFIFTFFFWKSGRGLWVYCFDSPGFSQGFLFSRVSELMPENMPKPLRFHFFCKAFA